MATFSPANRLILSPSETGISLVKPLALRAMFWRPSYLEASSWLEHIPFAFWIIEASQPKVFVELGADYGASYFAHCQAIDKLGLDTQSFAIDAWGGSDSSNKQGSSVFDKVNAYNESQYSGFSNLLRSSIEEAAHHFADGTVDLLHINGLNTSGFSLRDFEVWLPKLSDRAIVLLHGTNARERNFGIFKLYEQLQTRYPTFEFSFGQGLGLIGVGNTQNEIVQLLLDANKNERAKQAIHEVFFRLGRACADSFAVIKHKENIQNLNDALGRQNSQLAEIRLAFETAQAELSNRSAELNDARNTMGTQVEQHAIERGQLSEKITLLQEIRSDLKQEVEKWQTRMDDATTDLHRRIEEMARLEQSNNAHRQQIETISNQLQAREANITALQNDGATKQAAIEALRTELTARDSANGALAQEIVAHQQHTVALQEANGSKQAALDALQAELAARNGELAQLQSSKHKLADENLNLQQTISTLTQETQDHRRHVAVLQGKLQDKESMASILTEKVNMLTQEQAKRFNELAELTRDLVTSEQSNEQLKVELNTRNAELAQEIVAHQQHTALLQEANGSKQAEIEALNGKMETRFKELAEMTRHLMANEEAINKKNQQLHILQKQALGWKNDTAWKQPMRMPFRKADKYEQQIEQILLSGLFDTEWYLKQYPDVAKFGKHPVAHYLSFGAAENRDPSPVFCTAAYRAANREALADGKNPLLHYLEIESQRTAGPNQ